MATLLHRVRDNFKWKIEAITPQLTHSSRASLPSSFKVIDKLKEGEASGITRRVRVERVKGSASIEPSNQYSRWSPFSYVVEVYYASEFSGGAIDNITAQDGHDIQTALENPDSWVGYNASNDTDDIGIKYRFMDDGSEVIESENTWILKMIFTVIVKEVK